MAQAPKDIIIRIILDAGEDTLTNQEIVDKYEAAIKAWMKELVGDKRLRAKYSPALTQVQFEQSGAFERGYNAALEELNKLIDDAS